MEPRDADHLESGQQIDSILGGFRAEEAELQSDRRGRIDARLAAFLDDESEVHSPANATASVNDGSHLKVWVGVLGAAAAILVVALVGVLLRPAPDGELVAAPAPMRPNDFVVAASGSADHRLLSGTQLYRRVLVAHRGAASSVVVRTTETWVAEDGSGKLEASAESVLDGRAPEGISLLPKLGVIADPGELDFAGFTYAQLRGLPADGRQLLAEVEQRVRSEDPTSPAVASLLAELLSLEIVPPPVRAAAVQALFLIGAEPVGDSRAPDGRVGEAVRGAGADGREWVLVLDDQVRSMAFVAGRNSLWSGVINMDQADNWTTYGATALTRIKG